MERAPDRRRKQPLVRRRIEEVAVHAPDLVAEGVPEARVERDVEPVGARECVRRHRTEDQVRGEQHECAAQDEPERSPRPVDRASGDGGVGDEGDAHGCEDERAGNLAGDRQPDPGPDDEEAGVQPAARRRRRGAEGPEGEQEREHGEEGEPRVDREEVRVLDRRDGERVQERGECCARAGSSSARIVHEREGDEEDEHDRARVDESGDVPSYEIQVVVVVLSEQPGDRFDAVNGSNP